MRHYIFFKGFKGPFFFFFVEVKANKNRRKRKKKKATTTQQFYFSCQHVEVKSKFKEVELDQRNGLIRLLAAK